MGVRGGGGGAGIVRLVITPIVFKSLAVRWVGGPSLIIMPLCGPSCKLVLLEFLLSCNFKID